MQTELLVEETIVPRFSFGTTTYNNQNFSLDEENKSRDLMETDEIDSDSTLSWWHWDSIKFVSWLILFLVALTTCFIIIPSIAEGGILGGGSLTGGWSGEGAKRQNDRNVQVSSWWSGVAKLNTPTFEYNVSASTSSNPAIWGGKVFYTNYNGYIYAFDIKNSSNTGNLTTPLWMINICVELFGNHDLYCKANAILQKYISIATPTVWEDKLIISIKYPAAIVVIYQDNGKLVSHSPLISNPLILDHTLYAEISQSGTVWQNVLYVGTSISKTNAVIDKASECVFHGQFFAIYLPDLSIKWSSDMRNPGKFNTNGTDVLSFAGLGIKGSSPAISSRHNSVYFTVGDAYCASSSFWNCLNSTNFIDWQYVCLDAPQYNQSAFDSIVSLDLETGNLIWFEKLYGHRIWQLACNSVIYAGPRPNPCDNFPSGQCPFEYNRFKNCGNSSDPATYQSYDWNMDPSLQIHANRDENIVVGQNSGVIYYLNADRRPMNFNEPLPRSSRFVWATQVVRQGIIGGLAMNKQYVYFTLAEPSIWYIDNSTNTQSLGNDCGGWGALNTENGLAGWGHYIVNPSCTKRYDVFFGTRTNGIFSPPTVSNDVLLLTSGDLPINDYDCISPQCRESCIIHCEDECNCITTDPSSFGGQVYIASAKNGSLISSYNTGAGFYHQGFALHDNCIFTGNGYLNTYPDGNVGSGRVGKVGTKLIGWCIKTPIISECSIL